MKILLLIFIALVIIFNSSASFGQISPLWGELKKGNFAVGYKVFETKDYARATRPNGFANADDRRAKKTTQKRF